MRGQYFLPSLHCLPPPVHFSHPLPCGEIHLEWLDLNDLKFQSSTGLLSPLHSCPPHVWQQNPLSTPAPCPTSTPESHRSGHRLLSTCSPSFRGRQQHMQLTLHRKPSATLCPGPSYLLFRTQLRGQLFWEAEPDPTKLARWFPVCINHQVLKVPTHFAVCPGWLTESGDFTVCLNPIHPAQGLVQTRHTSVYYVNNWINECTNMTTIIMTFPVIKHQLYLISSVIRTEEKCWKTSTGLLS